MRFLVVFPMTCCQMPSVKASPMDTLKKCCAAFHCRKMAKTDQLMPRMLMVAMGSLKFSNNPVMMSLMVRLVFMRVNLPQLQFCKHIDQMHVRIAFHGFVKLSFSFRWRLGAYDLTRHYWHIDLPTVQHRRRGIVLCRQKVIRLLLFAGSLQHAILGWSWPKKKAFGTASGYLGLRIGALPSTTHSQFVGVECCGLVWMAKRD